MFWHPESLCHNPSRITWWLTRSRCPFCRHLEEIVGPSTLGYGWIWLWIEAVPLDPAFDEEFWYLRPDLDFRSTSMPCCTTVLYRHVDDFRSSIFGGWLGIIMLFGGRNCLRKQCNCLPFAMLRTDPFFGAIALCDNVPEGNAKTILGRRKDGPTC